MKKTFRNLLMAFLFLVTLKTVAADGIDLKISDEQSLIVDVQKTESEAILSILDQTGNIVFRDWLTNQKSYTKVFDFNSLSQGEYSVVLDKKFSISTTVIQKNKEDLSIEKNSYRLVFKPLYKESGDKVSFYFANPEENRVEIKIFDKFGEPVGGFKCKDVIVKRTLDFSEVPAGSYIVKIKTKTDNFSKTIIVG